MIISFIYKILSLFQIVPDFSENELFDVVSTVISFLGLMGVVVDPTTEGLSDSERALSYYKTEKNKKGDK